MEDQSFTTSVRVEQTPEKCFTAINSIKAWWSEDVEGSTDKIDDNFLYRDKHLWCKMKITELVPGEKVVWHVLESRMDNFEEGTEWNNTKLIFKITTENHQMGSSQRLVSVI